MFKVALVVVAGSLGLLMVRYFEPRDKAAILQRQVEAELKALRKHLFG